MSHYSQRAHLLLILSLLIAFFSNLIDSSTPTCGPFTCGNYTINYPFWLSDTVSFCGYPGFGLSCTNQVPILKLSFDSYYVTQINYAQKTFTLLDTGLAGQPCPRARHNVSLHLGIEDQKNKDAPHSTPLLNYSSPDSNLTFFFGCSSSPSSAGLIRCLSSNRSWSFVFRGGDEEIRKYEWNEMCEESVVVPVQEGKDGERLTDGGFAGVVQEGFEVAWYSTGEKCEACEESQGSCGYVTRSNGTSMTTPVWSGCYCGNGSVLESCKGVRVDSPTIGGGNSTAGGDNSTRSAVDPTRGSVDNSTRGGGNSTDGGDNSTRGAVDPTRGSVDLGGGKSHGPGVKIKIIIGALLGVGGLFLAFIVSVVFKRKFVKKTNDSNNNVEPFSPRRRPIKNVEAFLQNYGAFAPKRYQYSELKKMTNSFKDKLGEGAYGGVFKGKIKDGRLVAVKVLNNSKGNGEEFINEVASISRTAHVNIVALLGFCYEGSKRALIYEFMSNGSLEKFIYSNKLEGTRRILNCEKLFQIALGIARGLEYLHRGCSTRILHFDIKPHNILLDDEFCPKISDFGLAKLCPNKHESIISMQGARGTVGYIAPEVYCRNIGGVSHKSDVYSYGMMVLEMVGGRKNIDAGAEKPSEIYFPHWVYDHIALEDSLELIGIVEEEERQIARKMVLVGLWCIQTDPTNRPSMNKVLEMLEGNVQSLEMPPKPYLSSS